MITKTKQDKMYVWRLAEKTGGGLYTAASTVMNDEDLAVYNTTVGDSDQQMWFVKTLNNKYLTDVEGSISMSKYPSYEICMDMLTSDGYELQMDTHKYPTVN